ncbi:hypothetical protein [Methylobacterium nigriterrae]|uniref:hypothetical protein n=1 Tax=Methylobacterium nigriterrae TaxID=3127512 RepID=UPI003013C895
MPDTSNGLGPDPAASAQEDPTEFSDAIRDQALSYVSKRKQDVARAVSDVAEAIRSSGSGFANYPHVRAFFDTAAEGVEEFSEGINRRTVGEIYDEVEAAVRRRPGVALAGAALAGFALFRFFQASEIRPIPRSHAVVPVDVFPTPDI